MRLWLTMTVILFVGVVLFLGFGIYIISGITSEMSYRKGSKAQESLEYYTGISFSEEIEKHSVSEMISISNIRDTEVLGRVHFSNDTVFHKYLKNLLETDSTKSCGDCKKKLLEIKRTTELNIPSEWSFLKDSKEQYFTIKVSKKDSHISATSITYITVLENKREVYVYAFWS